MNVVYVLSPDKVPLMPCSCVIARLLLKEGKAKVVRRTPFAIKLHTLLVNPYTQVLTLGVDTGSSVMGSAVAAENGTALYLSEVIVRNDIAKTMKERMEFSGNTVALKPIPKFEKIKRVSARSSWMMRQRTIPKFLSSLI